MERVFQRVNSLRCGFYTCEGVRRNCHILYLTDCFLVFWLRTVKILSLPRSGGVTCIHETQQRLYDRVQDVKLNYVVQTRKNKYCLGMFFLETVHTSR